ncbi:metal ABC transporter substrate-binding protein, partial [Lactobacillus mulieris]|nr:metal ABC transporter substrate-binding protein [Lactobacillus mulieris]
MKKLGFIAVLFLAIIGLAACAGQKGTSANKSSKLNVVATNSIIADITKNIAGDK